MNNPRGNDASQPPIQGNTGNPMLNHQITAEEMRVLDECNWESFIQRSMPIGTALGTATYMAVQRGIFRPNLRFGAAPKVTIAIAIGYFLGKVSYHRQCAEKLMALPGSRIGQMLRDIKEGKAGVAAPPMTMYGATQDDIYSDAGPGSSLDIDTDRPIFSADDTLNSEIEAREPTAQATNKKQTKGTGTTTNPEVPQPSKPVLSYDDLRKRNREQYTDVSRNPYRMEPGKESLGPPPPVARSDPRPSRPSINKYGDIVD